ncbi:Endo-1,4-beta-xylanase 5-like [Sesamum angolense]|uniref:Endo-1,4-beta-xylanase 5-like n=1 Tax=Sesamum angolense TaxID=2727404 RepID=A0AAE1X4I6_9LAMI|nr:Endo-1,4-beta-xylanase 5-like [Sesamum angolense]
MCLAKPLRPQYDGGIVVNPELKDGLKGWTTFGDAKVEHGQSSMTATTTLLLLRDTNPFIVSRRPWLQVSDGNADIAAVFKTQNSYETAGWVTAQKGCWSMLKGGIVVNASGPADLFFQSNNTEVDIWASSISLQPFTHEEWKSHQQQSIEKVRKRRVKLQAVDQHGRPIANATVSIKQRRPNFPLGCAINQNILRNSAYQNWWSSRFKYTVFENELKWYSNERSRGSEDYSVSDALVQFARSRGAAIRGHNVFWNDPRYQPSWVGGLSTNDLWGAANKRIYSVVGRYKGQLFHWDVVNENLHYNFFESKLGYNASNVFYQKANQIDSRTTPFLNEYNTIEESKDGASSPSKYLQKISQLRNQGSAIDTLATAKLPIWVTELDVSAGPNQANYLEQILWELHSHYAVQGIILWAAWSPQGCYRMCLTDNNFRNLATGNVVDKVRGQWGQADGVQGTTDSEGLFEASLYHGEYEAKISHPKTNRFSNLKKFSVLPNRNAKDLFHLKIRV